MTRRAPRAARVSCRSDAVVVAVIATFSASSMGPVSRPSSICMMVTPVSLSPAMIARWIGAAPRQRGSSEACTLMQPLTGVSSMGRGRINP